MTPSITAGTAARVGAMAFVVLAIATTAVHFKPAIRNPQPLPPRQPPTSMTIPCGPS